MRGSERREREGSHADQHKGKLTFLYGMLSRTQETPV